MNVNDPFIKDALRGVAVMILAPLVCLLVFSRVVAHLAGAQMGWQDVARGVAVLLFIYVIVMRQRYRRFFQ